MTDRSRRLLLHICCGPCATVVIDRLRDYGWDVTGYFYNPNIHPLDEYCRRLDAARTVAAAAGCALHEGPYETERFDDAVAGYESAPENGARCLLCYGLRLTKTAREAVRGAYDAFASTLTTGPMKKAALIDPIGESAAQEAGTHFVAGDWKKRDGYRHSCERTRELGIYRQHYCGCRYSLRPRNGEDDPA